MWARQSSRPHKHFFSHGARSSPVALKWVEIFRREGSLPRERRKIPCPPRAHSLLNFSHSAMGTSCMHSLDLINIFFPRSAIELRRFQVGAHIPLRRLSAKGATQNRVPSTSSLAHKLFSLCDGHVSLDLINIFYFFHGARSSSVALKWVEIFR